MFFSQNTVVVQLKLPGGGVYRHGNRSVRMDVPRQMRLHWVVVVARHAHVLVNFEVRVPVPVSARTVALVHEW